MKTIYLDFFSGISGDMMVGALIDLGVKPSALEWELSKLELGDFHMHYHRAKRKEIEGVKFDIHGGATHQEHGHGDCCGHEHGHSHEHGHEHEHAHAKHEHGHEHPHAPIEEDHDHGSETHAHDHDEHDWCGHEHSHEHGHAHEHEH